MKVVHSKRLYLAGGISSYTYDEAEAWRDQVRQALKEHSIDCYSPLRAKSFLQSEGVLNKAYEYNPLSSAKGILYRDHDDCCKADLIFVNFLKATSTSVGTAMELAWAMDNHIIVVAVMEKDTEFNTHPMMLECITYRVETLEEGIHVTKAVLLP
jgi:nucleoside 2-deoxyribosyltransferase